MYDYFEEPYYEPTIADEIFFEAREKLINSLKETVKQHLENVVQENENLKKENEKMKQEVTKIRNEKRVFEDEKKNYESKLKRSVLSELLNDLEVIVYSVGSEEYEKQKCDKCNDSREIKYFSPTGKMMFEACECYGRIYKKVVQENILYEFKKDRNNTRILMWFKPYNSDEDGYTSGTAIQTFYDNYEFEDIEKQYNVYFRIKENAELYCEYLNKKNNFPKDKITKVISRK